MEPARHDFTLGTARRLALLAAAALLTLGLPPAVAGSEQGPGTPAGETASSPFAAAELAPLAGFLGAWEIDSKWADGTPLWSRNEFSVGLGGNFVVARTFARNEQGETYQRYTTYFGFDKASGNLVSHGFTYDGTMTVVDPVQLGGEPGRESLTSQWSGSGPTVRQTVQLTSPTSYSWKVWILADGDRWEQVMEGVWHRVD